MFVAVFEQALGGLLNPFQKVFAQFPGQMLGQNSLRWSHMIRNRIFLCKSLGISYVLTTFSDSRHVQLAIYTVFHVESESAVKTDQFLHPEEKTKKN